MKHRQFVWIVLGISLCLTQCQNHYKQAEEAIATQNYRLAREVLDPLAEKGDKKALSMLQDLDDKGLGLPQDLGEIEFWLWTTAESRWLSQAPEKLFTHIAKINNADLFYKLGHFFEVYKVEAAGFDEIDKLFVDANLKPSQSQEETKRPALNHALYWYQKAADLGHPQAMMKMWALYYKGYGVVKADKSKALDWIVRAASTGDPEQQTLLARMYRGEEVMTRDFKESTQAMVWFLKAAGQNHGDALYEIGRSYFNGWGVKKNVKEALSWYHKGAEHGHQWARLTLARLYAKGGEVPKEAHKATEWYKKIIAENNPDENVSEEAQSWLKTQGIKPTETPPMKK